MRATMIITIFFGVTIEMKAKGQRGTRSHCIMSFLQCSANGLASLLCSRKKIFVRLLIFRDIAWEDSLDRRGTSEIYTLTRSRLIIGSCMLSPRFEVDKLPLNNRIII